MKELDFYLHNLCCNKKDIAISGCFFFNGKVGRVREFFSFIDGKFCRGKSSEIYDLASLTKVLVTIPSLLVLLDKGCISVNDTVARWYRGFCYDMVCDITVKELVNHISGLPAHKVYSELFVDSFKKDRFCLVEKSILQESIKFSMKKQIYSDLGYLLLGRIIEKESLMALNFFWKKEISVPLGIENELFFPGDVAIKNNVIPTQKNRNKNILRVHDDNCRFLGGVAGHAGLFGTTSGVLTMCEYFLDAYHKKYEKIVFSSQNFIKQINDKEGERRFGFDIPSKKGSSCGNFFSEDTIGHLGFTGTSLWIDLKEEVGIVLLTNRVISEDSEWIKKLRPKVHNIIMNYIKKAG